MAKTLRVSVRFKTLQAQAPGLTSACVLCSRSADRQARRRQKPWEYQYGLKPYKLKTLQAPGHKCLCVVQLERR